MSKFLNVQKLVMLDKDCNVQLPGRLSVKGHITACSPLEEDNSTLVATTEWVRAYTANLSIGGSIIAEEDPIWLADKYLFYTKQQADARYLQSFTELDPTVPAHVKAISTGNINNWTAAFTWGNHALAGYLTSFTETDPIWIAEKGSYFTKTEADNRFLQAFTETDPTVPAHVKTISTTNISNWNTAYNWGNHGTVGYLTSYTETDPVWTAEKTSYYTKTQADTRYLQSFTETDPIWTSEKANYALKTYVDTSISNLVASAPAALDTLNELAIALGNDANFSTSISTLIGTKEPAITAGTTLQYWRGDKTWQTLPTYNLAPYLTSATAATTYVPYTGAIGPVDLGTNTLLVGGVFSSNNISAAGLKSYALQLAFNPDNGYGSSANYMTIISWKSGTTTNLRLADGDTAKSVILQLTNTANNTYTLPNASGTIALTSNLSSYVPTSRILTINGTALDLSADRSWTIATYTLPIATASVLGGIKIGSGLSIDAAGVVSAAGTYTLPIASATVLGGIKVGANLAIDVNGVLSSTDTNTTYVAFTGATTVANGTTGLVTAPLIANRLQFLRGDGTWATPTDTTYAAFTGATGTVNGSVGLVTAPLIANKDQFLKGDGTWATPVDTNTTYSLLAPATTQATIRLLNSVSGFNEITFSAAGGMSVDRINNGEIRFTSTDTNTTYTAGTGLTLTGTVFSITKAISTAETADTIALRDASGYLNAVAFFETSDIRFKNVLETNPTVLVDGIEVIKFTMKGSSLVRYGYSAQQVRQFVPEAVSGVDKLTVNYSDVHTLKIAALEKRVAELEAKLNSNV